ncbi:hypothetical protein BO71DRAFT_402010 [Aspergillus ellipticus CBS 707.79]|uniref:HMG box domain-containing protein n=1 Tax=Aspergillus ellipticus CBS 707.79 TaxID=1448320 RepID=A0A319D0Y2_9EURO|nr:hypothetical protein BO71DRAFT_402010 [Aspergillus ellipticus CBS 707.79]
MPLNLARCGGGLLQHLSLGQAFSRPVRVAISQGHARRLSLATLGRFSPNLRPASVPVVRSGSPSSTYATAAAPKSDTDKKATKSSKTAKTTEAARPKAAKTTKSGRRAKTVQPAKTKKKLTPEEQEAAKAKKEAAKAKKQARKKAEKEAKKASDHRLLVKQLKEAALSPPKKAPTYYAIAVENYLEALRANPQGLSRQEIFTTAAHQATNMSGAEREKYEAASASQKEAYPKALQTWLESHTPLQIKQANEARRRLAKIQNKRIALIPDSRRVKFPQSAFFYFVRERRASGGLTGLSIGDASRQMSSQWKEFTAEEKQKYVQAHEADMQRYIREYKETYGEEPKTAGKSSAQE